MTSSKINLSKPPKFLSILGASDVAFDEKKKTMTMHFDIGDELTHSDSAFV